jgi:hypothetical protein
MLPSGNGPVATTVLAGESEDPRLDNILTIRVVMLTESNVSGPDTEVTRWAPISALREPRA